MFKPELLERCKFIWCSRIFPLFSRLWLSFGGAYRKMNLHSPSLVATSFVSWWLEILKNEIFMGHARSVPFSGLKSLRGPRWREFHSLLMFGSRFGWQV